MSRQRSHLRYFADENALGVAKLLLRERDDVVHPGHPLLSEVPLGATDLEWMPVVSRLGLIVLTRDRRIRTRPAELRAYWEQRIRSVWLGGKKDMTSEDLVEYFLQHEQRLTRHAVKEGPGPWAVTLNRSGIKPIQLLDPR